MGRTKVTNIGNNRSGKAMIMYAVPGHEAVENGIERVWRAWMRRRAK